VIRLIRLICPIRLRPSARRSNRVGVTRCA